MDRNDLRIGDAEREQTMAALREHFAQGRLTHEELDERLDQTLTAKTARDLAKVTADLPGPAVREPVPHYEMDAWREAMRAHHQQLQSMRHVRRDMRRQWSRRPGRRPHGPGPFVPMLFVFMMLGLIFGGFGIFKVIFMVWLVAMIFSVVHRRFHYRR
ncbi:DUF1707 domain-containing protein [Nonomuraea sp. H19]|uniref:DUF1707 SHOCT-like domain-containing protein n=1 Tax=Nonomuraea sp. H19 TaxID=3452206 RepID=UPI003F8CC3BA